MSGENETAAVPEPKKRSGGKTPLVQVVRECGLSVRKSIKLVNLIFDKIGTALRDGETVEVPIGTFSVQTYHGSRKAYDRKAVNIGTSKPMQVRGTRPGVRKVIRWRPCAGLLGEPETPAVQRQEAVIPPRETAEDAEAYRLSETLLNGNLDPALLQEIYDRGPDVKAYGKELGRVIGVQSYVGQLLGGPAPAKLVEELLRITYGRGATTERLLERLRELGQRQRILAPNEILAGMW